MTHQIYSFTWVLQGTQGCWHLALSKLFCHIHHFLHFKTSHQFIIMSVTAATPKYTLIPLIQMLKHLGFECSKCHLFFVFKFHPLCVVFQYFLLLSSNGFFTLSSTIDGFLLPISMLSSPAFLFTGYFSILPLEGVSGVVHFFPPSVVSLIFLDTCLLLQSL